MKIRGIILAFAVLVSGLAADSQTISDGRNSLFTDKDIPTANLCFSNILAKTPADPTANVFRAVTRILLLPSQPIGSNFLNRLGVSKQGRDLFNWTATVAKDTNNDLVIPPALKGNELTTMLRTNVLSELLGAETNLAKITNTNFTLVLTEDETQSSEVTLGYADIQMLRAALKTSALFLYTTYSWNLDAQISSIKTLASTGGIQAVFASSTNLFKYATTNDLSAAKTAFQNAASLYLAASPLIRDRSSDTNWLINWDGTMASKEEEFRLTLMDLTNSLAAPVVATENSHFKVNAGRFFNPTNTVRSWLPAWGMDGFISGSLPDPTFGGIVLGADKTKIENALAEKIHPLLRATGTSLSTVYAFGTNVSFRKGISQNHSIMQATDGSVYILSPFGSDDFNNDSNPAGMIYKITSSGVFSVVTTNFDDQNGYPFSLAQGDDGIIYGATLFGGAYGCGNFFKIEGNKVIVLCALDSGALNGLVKGKDGNFYAICGWTFVRIVPTRDGQGATVTHLADFSGQGNDFSPLICGTDGTFYGMGGFYAMPSSAFSVTANGEYKFLANIEGQPFGALVQDAAGSLFGISEDFFDSNYTEPQVDIFKIPTGENGGTISTLCSIARSQFCKLEVNLDANGNIMSFGPDNSYSLGIDKAGNLIGSSRLGGGSDRGVLFRVRPNGDYAPVVWFEGNSDKAPGAYPEGNLITGLNGSVYGLTVCDLNNFGSPFSGNLYKLTETTPPMIVSQPANTTNLSGSAAVLSVVVSGADTLKYQWKKNEIILTNSTRVSGATTNMLVIKNLAASDAGNYKLIVSNSLGSAVSTVATLSIAYPPTIPNSPLSQVVSLGKSTTIKVDVNGNANKPLTYSWYLNGAPVQSGIISTIAGSPDGSAGFSGDGDVAVNSMLYTPSDVALDSMGNIFICDRDNNCIRKISTNGLISTVAGSQAWGDGLGDGGAATNACLSFPSGIALDGSGNLFIADSSNHRIRKVDTKGVITTVAGSDNSDESDDSGTLLVGDGGLATEASLYLPDAVAVDKSGNLFIADTYHNSIRKVDTNGIITTVTGIYDTSIVGDGVRGTNTTLAYPSGIALDSAGNLFIADTYNSCIRKLGTNGNISLVAGNPYTVMGATEITTNQVGTNATLYYPAALSMDSAGNLYFAETQNGALIRKIDTNGVVTTVAGDELLGAGYYGDGGPATEAFLNNPASATADSAGNIYIADQGNNVIRKVSYNTVIRNGLLTIRSISSEDLGDYQLVISNPWGSVTSAVINVDLPTPVRIETQPLDLLALNNSTASFSAEVKGSAPISYQWLRSGTNISASTARFGGSKTNSLTIRNVASADIGNYRLVVTNAYGKATSSLVTLGIAYPPTLSATQSSTNQAATLGKSQKLQVNLNKNATEPLTYQWLLNGQALESGVITTIAGNGDFGYSGDGAPATNATLANPAGITVDKAGNVYIADFSNNLIRKVDTNGIITTVAGSANIYVDDLGDGGMATDATLSGPVGIAVDDFGTLFIADMYNGRVRKVDTNGIITSTANVNNPSAVVLDKSGNLYIAAQGDNLILKLDTNGSVSIVTGNFYGNAGFYGDGGDAIDAAISYPTSLAIDKAGNLFIADHGNACIRKIDTNGIITTVAGYPGDETFLSLQSLCFGVSGKLYVTDAGYNLVKCLDTNGVLTTVAGNGTYGYAGDGGDAANAVFYSPTGIAADSQENLYIADENNQRIRKITYDSMVQNGVLTIRSLSTNELGCYHVIISSAWGSVTSSVINVDLPPKIAAQPANQTVLIGRQAGFSVGAAAATPVAYQWLKNGTNLPGGNIGRVAGTRTSNLTITLASASDIGNYKVVITNGFGSITSSAATLTIAYPPSIPPSQIVTNPVLAVGGTLTIKATPTGTGPFSYRWMHNRQSAGVSIINIAGGYLGDGQMATNATLSNPSSVAKDQWGNLYIADTENCRIRKIDKNGVITTVAGNGTSGSSVDGIAATNASLSYPAGVAVDKAGNLFIADTYNCLVRKVDTKGMITTVAGISSYGGTFLGDTSLLYPQDVAVDGEGNLYIADRYNNVIRKVDTTGITTTIAGNGTNGFSGDGGAATEAELSYPSKVAVDKSGNIFIVDSENNRIRKVDGTGLITTVAGNGEFWSHSGDGGAAVDTSIGGAEGITVDQSGNLYISFSLNSIRKVDANGIITTVAGNGSPGYSGDGGPAIDATLNSPSGLTIDDAGNLYVADGRNNCIRRVDANGIISTVAGGYLGDGVTATRSALSHASSIALDGAENLYIADQYNDRIRKVDTNGIITTVAGDGEETFSGDGGMAIDAALNNPSSIAVDTAGNVFIADQYNYRVRKVDTAGSISTVAGNGNWWNFPGGTGDGGAATSAEIGNPSGVAVDQLENFFIAESSGNCIRKVDSDGIITTIAGIGRYGYSGDGGPAVDAELSYPSAVAADQKGNIYIADTNNRRIRKIDTNGIISTLAGNNNPPYQTLIYNGIGSRATNDSLYGPTDVAVDKAGNVYIADQSFMLKVDTNGIITEAVDVSFPVTGLAVAESGNIYVATAKAVKKIAFNPNFSSVDGTLTISNATTSDLGTYQLVVFNQWASTESRPITVEFTYPAVITSQPASLRLPTGTNAVFSVSATGTSLAYQWRKNGTNVAGATNSVFTLKNLSTTNSGTYSVSITNGLGKVVSSNAVLAVYIPDLTAPKLTLTAPANASRVSNQLFQVTAKGVVTDNAGNTNTVLCLINGVTTNATVTGTNWSVTLPVNRGANTLGVYAVDFSGNHSATTNVSFVYVQTAQLMATTTGLGSVSPTNGQVLTVGTNYTAIATAARGYVFSNWSGSVSGDRTNASFIMTTNTTLVANFIPNPYVAMAGNYYGLFYATNITNVTLQSSGSFQATIDTNGGYTAKVFQGAPTTNYQASGVVKVSGFVSNQVSIAKTNVALVIHFTPEDGGQLNGTLSTTNWSASLVAYRNPYSAKSPAKAQLYTMAIGGSTETNSPDGYSAVSASVSTNGAVTFSVYAADGSTSLARSSALSQSGNWPLYAWLGNNGALIGWQTIVTNSPDTDLEGWVNWTKPKGNRIHPNGFNYFTTNVFGSTYITKTPLLKLTNGVILLSGANLTANITNRVALTNVFTDLDKTNKLSITNQSGVFTGFINNPKNSKSTNFFKGVLLQKQNIGVGAFVGTNKTGTVLIQGK